MWPFFTKPDADRIAKKAVQEYFQSDKFSMLVLSSMLETMRATPLQQSLSLNGFLLHIALEMYDRSTPSIKWDDAKEMALGIWSEYTSVDGVKFGSDGYDWTRASAIELAHEYQIQHWEP